MHLETLSAHSNIQVTCRALEDQRTLGRHSGTQQEFETLGHLRHSDTSRQRAIKYLNNQALMTFGHSRHFNKQTPEETKTMKKFCKDLKEH